MELYFDCMHRSEGSSRISGKQVLPPPPRVWVGDLVALFVGEERLPYDFEDLRRGWDEELPDLPDLVPRLAHWILHKGLPLLPDNLLHHTYLDFYESEVTSVGSPHPELSVNDLFLAKFYLRLALEEQAATFLRLQTHRKVYTDVANTEGFENVLLQLGKHMRKLRGLFRKCRLESANARRTYLRNTLSEPSERQRPSTALCSMERTECARGLACRPLGSNRHHGWRPPQRLCSPARQACEREGAARDAGGCAHCR